MDTKYKDIKLCKCPNCGNAFYVKTKKTDKIIIVCPFCREKVDIKVKSVDKKNDNGDF